MLLRDKTYECTVPKRPGTAVRSNPAARSMDLVQEQAPVAPNGAVFYKMMVFRIPNTLKTDYRVALAKKNLDVQHTFEAFAEMFVRYVEGERFTDPMKEIIKRSFTLANGI